MADFFVRNLITVFFFYGLSFVCMGFAILLEVGHASDLDFARALRPLGLFGIIHGSHEWFEMFLLINGNLSTDSIEGFIFPLRIFLLASSFMMLLVFGARMLAGPKGSKAVILSIGLAAAIWLVGLLWINGSSQDAAVWQTSADVYTRYALAVPGAALTAWGLLIQRRRFIEQKMSQFGRDVALAAMAFLIYGAIGQVFTSPSNIFLSPYLNSETFLRWFGFPIQVLRALMACFSAIFIVHSLRSFQVETSQRIVALKEAQEGERHRLEELRGELLHRTVNAQESERKRIAIELHDQIGQIFTALSMGLRGMAQNIEQSPSRAIQQAHQMEAVAAGGIQEMHRLVTGLHPAQLDDLGLAAALRWYIEESTDQSSLKVEVMNHIPHLSLPTDLRVVMFRIAQEALTNILRHAQATQAVIQLISNEAEVQMIIQDNGCGFDVEEKLTQAKEKLSFGLLGMMERAALVGGECSISSKPGNGTRIAVLVPRKG
jgi:signal transduction histidine kinase